MANTMNVHGERGRFDGLRTILAIAAKDIAAAIQNRTLLATLLGSALLLVSTRALYLLSPGGSSVLIVLVDQANSRVARTLQEQGRVSVYRVDDGAAMREVLTEPGAQAYLGVVLPDGQDSFTAELLVDGYYAHYLAPERASALAEQASGALSAALGRPVRIDTAGHEVYLPVGSREPLVESITFLLVILISTTFLVPYLLIEEKETRTLDALLVSPASVTQVVVGKALAGAGYGAAAALAMLSLSSRMVVHWEMAIAALACGIAFGVGLGLLLGISFETVQNMSLWMGLLAMVLLIPAVLGAFASPDWPPLVATILGWAPTSLLARAYRAAFWGSVPPDAGLWLLVVVAASVPLYALAIAKLRARDR